jgi:hypothetical protein
MLNRTAYKIFIAALSAVIFSQCADDSMLTQEESFEDVTLTAAAITSPSSCSSCTYVVPSNTNTQVVDGKILGLKPGAVICLNALNKYGNITFRNLTGTVDNPIIITNCGGTAIMTATGRPYNMKAENSKYFKITGGSGTSYGIRLNGGHVGLTLEKLSTNFEVNNVEVYNNGFAGIMAKTDPTCDDATIRGNFVMRDVSLHDNYVHDTKGEGFYVGNSFYEKGMTLSCGVRLPHTVEGVKIYNNKITNPGWEAIQVGCAIAGAYVYDNSITNYGAMNESQQNNGIQFSEGSKGICYGNMINGGSGTAINIIGHGDSFVHDNIIVNAGAFGIFADERTSIGAGFRFINNTIISPKRDGIRTYGDLVPNVIVNNIILNPGSYTTYVYPRTGNDAYVYRLNKTMNVQMSNNIFNRDVNYVKFVSTTAKNFRLTSTSPALNKGKDIRTYNIPIDYYRQNRLKGTAYDIGASEY